MRGMNICDCVHVDSKPITARLLNLVFMFTKLTNVREANHFFSPWSVLEQIKTSISYVDECLLLAYIKAILFACSRAPVCLIWK